VFSDAVYAFVYPDLHTTPPLEPHGKTDAHSEANAPRFDEVGEFVLRRVL
jgi:hypothetical protein